MAKRRGRGEGSISQRPDGRWQARVDLGRGPDGNRHRKAVYGPTRQAVASELNTLLGRAESGELLNTEYRPTVASWLNTWHRTHADEWRASTRRVYRIAIDQWLVPHMGAIRLEKLKPANYPAMRSEQRRDGRRRITSDRPGSHGASIGAEVGHDTARDDLQPGRLGEGAEADSRPHDATVSRPGAGGSFDAAG